MRKRRERNSRSGRPADRGGGTVRWNGRLRTEGVGRSGGTAACGQRGWDGQVERPPADRGGGTVRWNGCLRTGGVGRSGGTADIVRVMSLDRTADIVPKTMRDGVINCIYSGVVTKRQHYSNNSVK